MGRPWVAISLLAAALAVLGLTAATASASVESSIEGVWSFNGGRVAIQAEPNGKFVGKVVSPTRFAECSHEVGERMWTAIARQPDGSYWGLHQWFFNEREDCTLNPTLGPTAWRVLKAPGGDQFLRVCFSEPGSDMQPLIARGGEYTDTTYGCKDSALVSSLPKTKLRQYLALPGAGACIPRGKLRIRARDPENDPLESMVVTLRKGAIHRRAKVARRGKRLVATLSLRGVPAGRFTVRIRLTTVLGHRLSRKRTYSRCKFKRRAATGRARSQSSRDRHAT